MIKRRKGEKNATEVMSSLNLPGDITIGPCGEVISRIEMVNMADNSPGENREVFEHRQADRRDQT